MQHFWFLLEGLRNRKVRHEIQVGKTPPESGMFLAPVLGTGYQNLDASSGKTEHHCKENK